MKKVPGVTDVSSPNLLLLHDIKHIFLNITILVIYHLLGNLFAISVEQYICDEYCFILESAVNFSTFPVESGILFISYFFT